MATTFRRMPEGNRTTILLEKKKSSEIIGGRIIEMIKPKNEPTLDATIYFAIKRVL